MRKEEEIQIRKLTVHVNDRPINILAPVRVPSRPVRSFLQLPAAPLKRPKKNVIQKINSEEEDFFQGVIDKMNDIYVDIRKNPHLQVSGLKSARTSFKIPLISRNKDKLKQLLALCVAHEQKVLPIDRRAGIIDKLLDTQKLFKFDLERNTKGNSLHAGRPSPVPTKTLEEVILERLNSHTIRQKKLQPTGSLPPRDLRQLQPTELGQPRLKFN